MLKISGIDHVGIRIGDRNRSIEFYRALGFKVVLDAGFDDGHPIVMKHSGGVVLICSARHQLRTASTYGNYI